ncbi:acyltransferase family protein [Cellulomonas carbonis]|uniref:Acyltransferase n=1 Tax=Cellulomonas carbonis T26 TaxID=947969 RepID=A0A0A0BW94_9CELL|nr:acyltransferase [Cellulomonas carbonis]KGM12658.1 acyltransferase [Cellulomonas carbonis T26]
MGTLRERVDRTPPRRERHVDLLRVVAIGAVVLGHWLIVSIREEDGVLTGTSALVELTWAHPLTWLFQVMPVFFVVGGFANAASLTAARRRGEGDVGWLLARGARLVPPVTVLLLTVAAAAVVARLVGGDPRQVGESVAAAVLPLWFLVAYLAVVLLTPVAHALHRRFGLRVVGVLLVAVAVGDAALLGPLPDAVGYGSFLLGWVVMHQVGFAWRDGSLPRGGRAAVTMLVGGLAVLVALTVLGPYPVSMVNVPGAAVHNASPPNLALLALGTAQLGLALAVRGPSERWLHRRGPWTAVVAASTVTFTLFLWHMPTVVLVGTVLDALGALPHADVGSGAWWAWRVPWLVLLAVVLAGIVAVVGRVEQRGLGGSGRLGARLGDGRADTGTGRAVQGGHGVVVGTVVVTAYLGAALGLLSIAWAGPGVHGPFGLSTAGLAAWLGGAAALAVVRRTRSRDRRRGDVAAH